MPQQNKVKPPAGKQAIYCNVSSCRHHSDGDCCALSSISVAPCQGGSTGKPDDESMCASYEVQ